MDIQTLGSWGEFLGGTSVTLLWTNFTNATAANADSWRIFKEGMIGALVAARSFLPQQDRIDRLLGATMVVFMVGVVVANVMNALSARPEVGAYLASLVLLLYVSCVMFGRLIFVLVQPRDAA
jgi:hypothetical protein